MGCVIAMTRRLTSLTGWWRRVCSYAYTARCSTSHVALGIATVLHRSAEWPDDMSCLIFEGDILSAFDNARPKHVAVALQSMGVPADCIASILEEQRELVITPDFQNLAFDEFESVRLNKCITQGGVHSTFCWNALIGYCIMLILPCWHSAGLGLWLNEELVTHMVWSDNVWLFARDQGQLQRMLPPLTRLLNFYGLSWKAKSLKIYPGGRSFITYPMPTFDFQVNDEDYHIETYIEGTVLGTETDKDGDTMTAVQRQILRAQSSFFAEKEVLLCRDVPFSKKAAHFSKVVIPVLLHGCGSWTCRQLVLKALKGFEGRCLRLMYNFRKSDNMDWVTWHRLAIGKPRKMFVTLGHKLITVRYMERLLKFASTLMSAPPSCAPLGLIKTILEWRDSVWWKSCQTVAEDMQVRTGWRHARPGGLRTRWDEIFLDTFGEDWRKVISAKMTPFEWKTLSAQFVVQGHNHCKMELSAPPIVQLPDQDFQPPAKKEKRALPPTWYSESFISNKSFHIEINGDSGSVISWLNGQNPCDGPARPIVLVLRQMLQSIWLSSNFGAMAPQLNFGKWIPRDYNTIADSMATTAIEFGPRMIQNCAVRSRARLFRVFFDGGFRENVMGAGWHLQQSWSREDDGTPIWVQGPQVAVRVHPSMFKFAVPANSTIAETVACWEATSAILHALIHGHVAISPHCEVMRSGILSDFNISS